MCSYSMIADHYNELWKPKPWYPASPNTLPYQGTTVIQQPPEITKAEFDDLKRQVMEMKELLKRAIKYDEENGEPECEMAEKVALLKRVAEIVGVDLSEVLQVK